MALKFQIFPFTQNGSSVLPPRNFMLAGQYLESPNKQYKLVFEADANLVLYNNGVREWVSDNSVPYTYVDSNPNKNLVSCFYMHSSGILMDHVHNRMWIATTSWIPVPDQAGAPLPAFLQLQDDGNIVIVDGVPTWARFGFTPTAAPRPRVIYPDHGTGPLPTFKEWTWNNVF